MVHTALPSCLPPLKSRGLGGLLGWWCFSRYRSVFSATLLSREPQTLFWWMNSGFSAPGVVHHCRFFILSLHWLYMVKAGCCHGNMAVGFNNTGQTSPTAWTLLLHFWALCHFIIVSKSWGFCFCCLVEILSFFYVFDCFRGEQINNKSPATSTLVVIA